MTCGDCRELPLLHFWTLTEVDKSPESGEACDVALLGRSVFKNARNNRASTRSSGAIVILGLHCCRWKGQGPGACCRAEPLHCAINERIVASAAYFSLSNSSSATSMTLS